MICLKCGLRECTVKPFEATEDDCRECLDKQSRPPLCSELVVGVLLNRENNHMRQCIVKLIAEVKTECKSCRRRGHVALETETLFEVEMPLTLLKRTRPLKWKHGL